MEEEICIEEFSAEEEKIEYLEEFTIEDILNYYSEGETKDIFNNISSADDHLIQQKKRKHNDEGIENFPLEKRIEKKEVRYPCDQCDYIAT